MQVAWLENFPDANLATCARAPVWLVADRISLFRKLLQEGLKKSKRPIKPCSR